MVDEYPKPRNPMRSMMDKIRKLILYWFFLQPLAENKYSLGFKLEKQDK